MSEDALPADATLVATEAEWDAAVALRMAVFVDEQGVSRELELDEHDERPLDPDTGVDHLLVRDGDEVVGVARLRGVDEAAESTDDGTGTETEQVESGTVAKIERVAVARDRRGEGLGARVMAAAEARARERGLHEALLHAQTRVTGFYERLGYEREGEPFCEDGIEHVRMRKRLLE